VVSVLCSSLGLSTERATRAMLDIHQRGGALLATSSWEEAQRAATQVMAEAATRGYPLKCRPARLMDSAGS
jgi:ATP-dependent Clp protease adapter protein ClpS